MFHSEVTAAFHVAGGREAGSSGRPWGSGGWRGAGPCSPLTSVWEPLTRVRPRQCQLVRAVKVKDGAQRPEEGQEGASGGRS